MLRVAHLLHELKPSGAEAMLRCAAPLWREHGIECEIVATGFVIGPYAQTLRDAGYVVHHLPNTRRPGYLGALRRFILAGFFDVVHQHIEGMSFWLGLAALSTGTGVVRTVHSNFHFKGNLKWRRGLQRRVLEGLGVVHVAIGQSVQRNEELRFGLKPVTIMNWADLEALPPADLRQRAEARARFGFEPHHQVILTLGNCSPIKNHALLIRALARCRDLDNLRYLHMGLEEPSHDERRLAEELGVADRIVFGGWAPSPKEALHAADAYVMPSLYEGFSIAALEALSAGLPAVLTDVPGLCDLKPLFPGLHYAAFDEADLADAVRRSVSLNETERAKLSALYRRIVLERFTASRGVEEYAALYRKVSPSATVGTGP